MNERPSALPLRVYKQISSQASNMRTLRVEGGHGAYRLDRTRLKAVITANKAKSYQCIDLKRYAQSGGSRRSIIGSSGYTMIFPSVG